MREVVIDVFPGVYPPSDDSYMLADVVNSMELKGKKFLEIGCGSGIVSITAAVRGAEVTAVDINPRAAECTLHNAEKSGVKIRAFQSDLFENVTGEFDVIAFNPPYLPGTEDDPDYDVAWSGGEDGRAVLDRFLKEFDRYLKPCGVLLLVHSSLNNPAKTMEILEEKGYRVDIVAQEQFFLETLYVIRAVKPCP